MRNKAERKNTGRIFPTCAKAAFAILLALCLCAGDMPVSADDDGYRTTTVTRGSIAVEANMPATYEFTKTVPVTFNSGCGSAVFMGYVTELNHYVRAGEPIANIATGVDEIALKEVQLRLQREEQAREKAYADMEEAHAAAERAVEQSSGTQNRIAQLRLEQLEMEQERSKRALDEKVAAVQEQLALYENAMELTQILAPITGEVNWLNYYSIGDPIPEGAQVGLIRSSQEAVFSIADANSILRYGMEVTLVDGSGTRYQAMVVSNGNKYLSSNFNMEKAYIKPQEQGAWGNNAFYENVHIDNVLLVDSTAVYTDENGTYVLELEDGKITKCYFTVGKMLTNLCYVIDGLSEGMTVIIQ